MLLEYKLRAKRVHRKSHGKFGFHELRRYVSARWKIVDDETSKVLKNVAAIEKDEYQKKVGTWKITVPDSKCESATEQTQATNSVELQIDAAIHVLAHKIQELQSLINRQAITKNPDLNYSHQTSDRPCVGLARKVSTIMPPGWDNVALQHNSSQIIPFGHEHLINLEYPKKVCSQSFEPNSSQESQTGNFWSEEEMENLFDF